MKICGKALPPRAALLLTADLAVLCGLLPLLLASSFAMVTPEPQLYSSFALVIRLVTIGLICQMTFYYNEMYNLQALRSSRVTFENLLQGSGMLLLLLGVLYAVAPKLSPGLERILAFLGILVVVSFAVRVLALPRRLDRVLVIGGEGQVDEVCEVVRSCPEWNIEVVRRAEASTVAVEGGPTPLSLAARDDFDGVIVCADSAHEPAVLRTLLDWKMLGVHVEEATTFFERATGRVRMDALHPDWFVFSSGFANGRRKRLVKRSFDLVVSSLLLVVALPVMALVALAILIEGHGPVLFMQERVGLHNRPFRIFKFRTMRPKDSNAPARWVSEDADRITRLGKLLRTFRLDELPQLLNVLRGEMSLVGPRPEQLSICDVLEQHIQYYRQRHTVPPGLTGWAQVRYHYGASIEESRRKTELDLFYVKHLSLWLDLAVLIETVKVVLVGRGAR